MAQSFFIWNGRDCRSMGVNLHGPVPIVRPEERVQHVEIPGRSGDLTEIEGEHIYNSYIQTASISVRGGFRVREVYKWLRGAGYVTFSGEPDRKQAARIVGAVTLNRHSRNLDKWEGEVQFYCQPLKEQLQEEPITLHHNMVIRNLGDVECRPKITATIGQVATRALVFVTAPQEFSPGDTDIPGAKLFSVDMTDNAYSSVIIDSEKEIVTDGTGQVDLTAKSAGDFPTMPVGDSFLAFTTGLTLSLERRMKYI